VLWWVSVIVAFLVGMALGRGVRMRDRVDYEAGVREGARGKCGRSGPPTSAPARSPHEGD